MIYFFTDYYLQQNFVWWTIWEMKLPIAISLKLLKLGIPILSDDKTEFHKDF